MFPVNSHLDSFTDVLGDDNLVENASQPISFPSSCNSLPESPAQVSTNIAKVYRPAKYTGQYGEFRSVEEIDLKYRCLFQYPYFNLVQSRVIEDALYSDNSLVVCAPTGSGKTVVFEMAILQLLMEIEDTQYKEDFKIIYMAPVKAVCNERLTEWYPKLTKLGLHCIEVTGDTEIDFSQLKPYKVIITTPEKWDMLTRRWRDHRGLVEMTKLFLIDEVHILNDQTRGPVLEAVVSRMKTIELAAQSAHRIEQLQKQYQSEGVLNINSKDTTAPRIRFVAISATVSNPEDVADWLGTSDKPAKFYKFGDECRPVKLKKIVEGYHCADGTSIFKFDIILNYKLWPIIQKYYNGKPTLIFCNTRKSVALTAETLSREITVTFSPEQKAKLTALASTIKNKKLQALIMSGVACHHAGLLYEERINIEQAFRNRDLPILITTTTLAMGVNLPAHLVIVKNTQQYVNGAYQEYSISTVLQMVGRAGRPQFDTEATAVIMTRLRDKPRYQALVCGSDPLQSYLHKRLAENLNSEAALGTVTDVAQCVEWLRSTFLYVRAAKDPKSYLGLPQAAPTHLILKKIEELCVKAMNSLASSGLITMDEASCIQSTEAGRLMSLFYLDVETMKIIMKIEGSETLDRLLWLICESHELSDMHLRVDERRCLNTLNRNNAAATIRFPMKGKISTRQMKLNCIIQAVLGCLSIPDPALNQEAMKIMRIADRVCKCLVKYVTRPELVSQKPQYFSAVLNSIILNKCIAAHLWENSPYVSKQLKGIGPTFSTLLAAAGITSFMLLEESHPRDLERIMNKGPPAGNILRKQVSLLPKYQLTVTPLDRMTVSVQLMLLNQTHLSENIDQLTAGDSHKSYLIVGDSDNRLLLLASFKDRDFISIYDGIMRYEITRTQYLQHKIVIHCISSSYVGIDTHAEYLFEDLAPHLPQEIQNTSCNNKNIQSKFTTNIINSDTERKRKNTSSVQDVTESKEKKKRENALTDKLKALKQSFGITSKKIKEDIKESTEMTDKILYGLFDTDNYKPINSKETKIIQTEKAVDPVIDLTDELVIEQPLEEIIIKDKDDEFIDDFQIDSILNDIESEMLGTKVTTEKDLSKKVSAKVDQNDLNNAGPREIAYSNSNKIIGTDKEADNNSKKHYIPPPTKASYDLKKRRNVNSKSNFNVIDQIEKRANIEDAEIDKSATKISNNDNCAFSDAIKSHIEKYLKNANNIKNRHSDIDHLLQSTDDIVKRNEMRQDSELSKDNIKITNLKLNSSAALSTEDIDLPLVQIKNSLSFKENKGQREAQSSAVENLNFTVVQLKTRSISPDLCSTDVNNPYKNCEADTESTSVIQDIFTANSATVNHDKDETETKENQYLHTKTISDDNVKKDVDRSHQLSELISFKENTENTVPMNNILLPYRNSSYVQDTADLTINNPELLALQLPYTSIQDTLPSLKEDEILLKAVQKLESNPARASIVTFQDTKQLINIPDIKGSTFRRQMTKPLKFQPPVRIAMSDAQSPNQNKMPVIVESNPDQTKIAFLNTSKGSNIQKISTTQRQDKGFETDANREEYIKRYSFSSTKMDVCMKSTQDYQVKVTRKLQVDLDITEILTKEKINLTNEHKPSDKTDLKMLTPQSSCYSVSEFQSKKGNYQDNTVTPGSDTCIDLIQKEKEVVYPITKNEVFGPANISQDDLSQNDKTIENILQKYSQVLIKNETCLSSRKSEETKKNDANSTKPKTEIKAHTRKTRPFRIKEIHNIDVPLPETITEASSQPISFSSLTKFSQIYTKAATPKHNKVNIQTDGSIIESNFNNEDEHVLNIYDDKNSFNDEFVDISPISDNSTSSDIKTDEMFNPKLLLQYLNKETDIDVLPPPPQFSDKVPIYSPSPIHNSYDYNATESQYSYEDGIDNATTFEENKMNTPTISPSEIETWTLSRDEHDSYTPSSPVNNQWIMSQRNSYDRNSSIKPSSGNLRTRLGQYKFVRKKVIKP